MGTSGYCRCGLSRIASFAIGVLVAGAALAKLRRCRRCEVEGRGAKIDFSRSEKYKIIEIYLDGFLGCGPVFALDDA